MERFIAVRRQTDSGRTRFWYVKDRRGVFPLWEFGAHERELINRTYAQAAARALNFAARHDLAYTNPGE